MPRSDGQYFHDDAGRFLDALNFTASQKNFSPRLIEKDYFCSLILSEFSELFAAGLVFKGGTALSKVHAGFYRLSEDLDFMISIESDATRSQRRLAFGPIKQHLERFTTDFSWQQDVRRPLAGARESSHYSSVHCYASRITGEPENVRIEISLRESLIERPVSGVGGTILLDPFTMQPAVEPIRVTTMSRRESYAEKIRAALCRPDPAIRDVYDLDHASRSGIVDLNDDVVLRLAQRKLRIPGNSEPDVSVARLDALERQLETQLRPVLRSEDFDKFDLQHAFEMLRHLNGQLSRDAT